MKSARSPSLHLLVSVVILLFPLCVFSCKHILCSHLFKIPSPTSLYTGTWRSPSLLRPLCAVQMRLLSVSAISWAGTGSSSRALCFHHCPPQFITPQHGTMYLSLDLQIADYGKTVQFFLQDNSLVELFLPTSVLSRLRAHCVAKPLGKEAVAVRKSGQDAFAKCIALTTALLFRHPPLLSHAVSLTNLLPDIVSVYHFL